MEAKLFTFFLGFLVFLGVIFGMLCEHQLISFLAGVVVIGFLCHYKKYNLGGLLCGVLAPLILSGITVGTYFWYKDFQKGITVTQSDKDTILLTTRAGERFGFHLDSLDLCHITQKGHDTIVSLGIKKGEAYIWKEEDSLYVNDPNQDGGWGWWVGSCVKVKSHREFIINPHDLKIPNSYIEVSESQMREINKMISSYKPNKK